MFTLTRGSGPLVLSLMLAAGPQAHAAAPGPAVTALIYVLEGSIVMGVKGGKEQTLGPGQTFYEGPHDVHTVGRNASKTRPARFVVFLLKDKGKPAVIPVKQP
ncbi:MAG: cupin domain-containing protein [Massilia sp.]|nr:cupin domain-containing protein [Massilia sp.]